MKYSPYIPSVVFLDPPVLPNSNLNDSEELKGGKLKKVVQSAVSIMMTRCRTSQIDRISRSGISGSGISRSISGSIGCNRQ